MMAGLAWLIVAVSLWIVAVILLVEEMRNNDD